MFRGELLHSFRQCRLQLSHSANLAKNCDMSYDIFFHLYSPTLDWFSAFPNEDVARVVKKSNGCPFKMQGGERNFYHVGDVVMSQKQADAQKKGSMKPGWDRFSVSIDPKKHLPSTHNMN